MSFQIKRCGPYLDIAFEQGGTVIDMGIFDENESAQFCEMLREAISDACRLRGDANGVEQK